MRKWNILPGVLSMLVAAMLIPACAQQDGIRTLDTDTALEDQLSPEQISEKTASSGKSAAPQDIADRSDRKTLTEAWSKGLFLADSDGFFHPDDPLTRIQFASALWCMADHPAPSGVLPALEWDSFSLEEKCAVSWCVENGCMDLSAAEEFQPDAEVSRQEAMKTLFQYHGGLVGMEGMLTRVYDDKIQDSSEIADWAKAGMYWGLFHEFIVCSSSMEANPVGIVSRADAAGILLRYMARFPKDEQALEIGGKEAS